MIDFVVFFLKSHINQILLTSMANSCLFCIISFSSFVYCVVLIVAATVSIEAVASPPNEGDDPGTAAVVRLTIDPASAVLAENIVVSVAVVTGGDETAVGKTNLRMYVADYSLHMESPIFL